MNNRGRIVLDAVSLVVYIAAGVWFIMRGAWMLAVLFSLPATARCIWNTAQDLRQLRRGQDKPPA